VECQLYSSLSLSLVTNSIFLHLVVFHHPLYLVLLNTILFPLSITSSHNITFICFLNKSLLFFSLFKKIILLKQNSFRLLIYLFIIKTITKCDPSFCGDGDTQTTSSMSLRFYFSSSLTFGMGMVYMEIPELIGLGKTTSLPRCHAYSRHLLQHTRSQSSCFRWYKNIITMAHIFVLFFSPDGGKYNLLNCWHRGSGSASGSESRIDWEIL
jgi:hypothetical protein